jgi:Uri superfamily endonuclease
LDLIKFENPERYSAFGKMKLSTRPSAPIFGFGSADRTKQAKVFQSKEMAKTEFIGNFRADSCF